MKFAAPILRFVFTLTAGFMFGGSGAHAQNGGGTAASVNAAPGAHSAIAKKDGASSRAALPPDLEKQLDDILGKVKERKAAYLNGEMKTEVDEIVQQNGLKDEGAHALSAAAKQAVDAALDQWTPQFPDQVRQELAAMPHDQLRQEFTEAEGQLEALAQSNIMGDAPAPDEQDVWTKALRQVLAPAQFDDWTQARTKRKTDAEDEVAGLLKNSTDRVRDQLTGQVHAKCRSIEDTLNLPGDRAAKLDDLGKSAVDQSVELVREQEEKYLLSLSEDQRRPLIGSGFFMSPQPGQQPTELSAWSDGLAHLLSADEQARLQAVGEEHKAKRERVMGEVMITLLDEKLALTNAQRQKLAPLANRLVKGIPQLYPPEGPEIFYSAAPQLFYAAAASVGDAELQPILDSAQMKRWHELSQPDTSTDVVSVDADTGTPVIGAGPEDVERVVSNFFYGKSEAERKRALEVSTLKAEDVVRVAGLNAESAERVQAAARGATEQYLATWKWFTEQQVRSQLQDLTPQNVRERLEAVEGFFYQRRFGFSNQPDIWDKTVQTELTTRQQDAWQKESDAREAYHRAAIADLALSELDRRAALSDAQWSTLRPLLVDMLTNYSQGISQIFGGMNGTPWYLNGPYMLIPFAGVDDKDLRSILSKDQMDAWTGSQAYATANNLWQVIKQMRGQRSTLITHGVFIQD
jgi:hypothetical protein